MAIEDASPARLRDIAAVSESTEDLRALLAGYAGILEKIDDAPPVLWARIERPRILRWWPIPAPRALVRTFLVRHINRSVSALKRRGASRVALGDDTPGPLRDLKMLEHFEQSLPTGLRLRLVLPLALLGGLLVGYILATYMKTRSSKLLGDLASAAVNLDRGAAVDAFKTNDLDPAVYFGASLIIVWSVTLVVVPLLPAFSVKRRILRKASESEVCGFAALGCRRVHDLEFDLVAHSLVIAAVALFAVGLVFWSHGADETGLGGGWIVAVPLICLTALAGVEVRGCYAARRTDAVRRHSRITRTSLWLVWGLNAWNFVYFSVA